MSSTLPEQQDKIWVENKLDGAIQTASQSSEYHQLKRVIAERSFRTGEFVLSSGQKSCFYLDARTTTLCADGAVLVGRLMWQVLEPLVLDAVGGLTLGADPVVSAVVMASHWSGSVKPVDGFLIRKEAKGHGAKRQVEGIGDNTQPTKIAIVEDVTTTGQSFELALEAIQRDLPHCEVVCCLSIVDRRNDKGTGRGELTTQRLPFRALYCAEQFLAEA